MKQFIRFAIFLSIIVCSTSGYCQEAREVRKSVELSKDGIVSIDTYKGSITIKTWEKPAVDILARIESDGTEGDEEWKVQETEIRINDSRDRVDIKTDYHRLKHRSSWFFGLFGGDDEPLPFVHYTISMPATARLRIKDYKSDTRISDFQGPVELNTYKGTVSILNLAGSIDLETYKGEAHVDMAGLSDDCRIETYKGRIELTLPKQASFDLETDLGRRADFDTDFDMRISGRHHDQSQATINRGGAKLHVNSEKGEISLRSK